ncbi:Uncharacterised protein [Mycobacterium xenopi]|nr:hypothetical protein I552_0208 [Mycobacterium xenopi 3993]SPX78272.1 Uncharacterised protein [Mycobacterium xenopi]
MSRASIKTRALHGEAHVWLSASFNEGKAALASARFTNRLASLDR